MSITRALSNMRQRGWKETVRGLWYIGDVKAGTQVGTDEFGNRYFENYNAAQEQPGRQRWVDYAQHDYNASQVPPGWRAWLSHIRELPPTKDAVVQASKQSWQVPYKENLTGTRGSFVTYSTTVPKYESWKPEAKPRA